MNDNEIKKLLDKSEESIKAGNVLFEEEFFGYSVSRYYYAMFYAAKSLLLTKGLTFSKHSSMISSFGKEFVKSGEIDKKYHKYLLAAYSDRSDADYSVIEDIDKDLALETKNNAIAFVEEIKRHIFKQINNNY